MFRIGTFGSILVACVTLILPVRAMANTFETFSLSGVIGGGSSLIGTFDYGPAGFSDFEISTVGGFFGGLFFTEDNGSTSTMLALKANNLPYSLIMNLSEPLPLGGGVDPVLGGAITNEHFSNVSTQIGDGVVETTPLPATIPLFATGLGGLGLLGWRRKRKAQLVAA
jgi:hypothetical protein